MGSCPSTCFKTSIPTIETKRTKRKNLCFVMLNMTYRSNLYLIIHFEMSSITSFSAGSPWGQLVSRPDFRYFQVSTVVAELVVATSTSSNELSMVAGSGFIWFDQSSAFKIGSKSPMLDHSEFRFDSEFDPSEPHFLNHLVIMQLLPAWSVETTLVASLRVKQRNTSWAWTFAVDCT
jgi:hypothetical protein